MADEDLSLLDRLRRGMRSVDRSVEEGLDYYLGPTGIPDRIRALNEAFNPYVAYTDAGQDFGRAMDPNLSSGERLGAAGSGVLNTAMMAGIPALMARMGYIPAREAVMEMLTGFGVSSPDAAELADDAMRQFQPRAATDDLEDLVDIPLDDDLANLTFEPEVTPEQFRANAVADPADALEQTPFVPQEQTPILDQIVADFDQMNPELPEDFFNLDEVIDEPITAPSAPTYDPQDYARLTRTDFLAPNVPLGTGQPFTGGIGHNGGPPLEDPVLSGLRSRLMGSVSQLPQERGTYSQMRAALIRGGGGAPAERELQFTGMDRVFAPDQIVTRDDLQNYLEGTTGSAMFGTNVQRAASGVTGEPRLSRDEIMERARQNLRNDPDGQFLFSNLQRSYPDADPREYEALYELDAQDYLEDLEYNDLLDLAGVNVLVPGRTSYSANAIPGLNNYFEQTVEFTDPGMINPRGQFGYAEPHDFYGSSGQHFMHMRGGDVSLFGGDNNARVLMELQSDQASGLRGMGDAAPSLVTPAQEAVIALRGAGFGDPLSESVWNQIQSPDFRVEGLTDDFFNNRLVLRPDDEIPTAQNFDDAVTRAEYAYRNVIGGMIDDLRPQVRAARDEVESFFAQQRADRAPLYDTLNSYNNLGYDSAWEATVDFLTAYRNGVRTGEADPVAQALQQFDIVPGASADDDAVARAFEDFVNSPSQQESFALRRQRAEENREFFDRRLSRYQASLDDLNSGIEAPVTGLRRVAIDTDVPEGVIQRIRTGEMLSDAELRQLAEDYNRPQVAAAVAAMQEFTYRNINPEVLRDIDSMGTILERNTRSAMPFVESTNQWVDHGLRRALYDAAAEGRDYLVIANPDQIRRATFGKLEGQRGFYGGIVPRRMQDILSRLDRRLNVTNDPQEFELNPDYRMGYADIEMGGQTERQLVIRLDPDLRARILGDESRGYPGLSTFAKGGMVTAPESLGIGSLFGPRH